MKKILFWRAGSVIWGLWFVIWDITANPASQNPVIFQRNFFFKAANQEVGGVSPKRRIGVSRFPSDFFLSPQGRDVHNRR
ncbi:MAG: hypothetical protein LBU34_12995 [Planctomycetaceae bacterium]|nr:hypothetical protein [Planctomycetaceae bacterium]